LWLESIVAGSVVAGSVVDRVFSAQKVRSFFLALMLVLGVALLSACGSDPGEAGETGKGESQTSESLLVATAASLTKAFTEIGEAFDQANGTETTFTFDASGALQKQIEAGAPIDVFVSASPVQVDNLLQKELVDETSITTFASNEMVLAVPSDSKLGISGFQDLATEQVKRVATADPQTAPQGMHAIEVLATLGLIETVQPKLIYSRSAPQTLTYVKQGEVDAGIMFATDALAGDTDVTVVEISDPAWHSEIAYVTAVVSASEAKTLGEAFIDFTTGPEGRAILQRYGFLVPEH
jgi:molybdate transport system substrate-binding protein